MDQKSRHDYDYRVLVLIQADRSAHSIRLPLESYSTKKGPDVGAWVLLGTGPREQVTRSGRAVTPNVGTTDFAATF